MPSESFTKLAIVVLSYNGRQLLEQFLPGIISTAPSYSTIYVVDNASTDDTQAWLCEHHASDVEVVRIAVNKGFTNGYTESLQSIEAEYYCLISNDVRVSENWCEPIIDLLEANGSIGACQPKVLSHHHPDEFEYSGAAGGYIDEYGYPFCRGRMFFDVEKDKHQYDNVEDVFWVSGACFFVRADLYHQLGGFDNSYFAHMEDIDLSWRIWKAGYKCAVQPAASVYHVGGAVITYGSTNKIFRNYRNGLAMITKNYTRKQLLTKLPIRLLLDSLSAWYYLLKGEPSSSVAILRGQLSYYKGLPHWIRSRKASTTVHPRFYSTVYPGSIVFQYFIKKKKKFSSLHWKNSR